MTILKWDAELIGPDLFFIVSLPDLILVMTSWNVRRTCLTDRNRTITEVPVMAIVPAVRSRGGGLASKQVAH